jgi:hypothetical protein
MQEVVSYQQAFCEVVASTKVLNQKHYAVSLKPILHRIPHHNPFGTGQLDHL